MKVLPCLLAALLCCSGVLASTDIFDFGRNEGQFIYSTAGQFFDATWTKRITIPVPDDMRVTFVRVGIDNRFSTPTVTYDHATSTVTISYGYLAVKTSRYHLVAVAVPLESIDSYYHYDPRDTSRSTQPDL